MVSRWRHGHFGRSLAVVALVVGAAGGFGGAPAVAQTSLDATAPPATSNEEVVKWLRRYLEQPPAKPDWRSLFPKIPPEQAAEAPAPLRLMAADHYLRSGHARVASQLFLDVLGSSAGTPLASLAQLGLAWSAVGSGDRTLARALLEDGTARQVDMPQIATILLALLEAGDGRYVEADGRLARALVGGDLPPAYQAVARLAQAYVRYWSGDMHAASIAFSTIDEANAAPELADDARYGAAWSRYRGGDPDGGISALRELGAAADGGGGVRRCAGSWELVQLAPRAVMRESFRRYRHGAPVPPDGAIVQLLDMDGAARACAALRFIERPSAVTAADAPAAGTRAVTPADVRRLAPDASTPRRAPTAAEPHHGRALALLLLLLACTLIAATRRRWRRDTRPR